MKRISEKVKDIVEVCPFSNLQDFGADAGLTLSSYRFTDITADLMAKWIDVITGIRPGQGTARALAGFRGVGKSHFLSVLGVILSRPELRERISDSYVASRSEQLPRRPGVVAHVRRGGGASLLDELKYAVSSLTSADPGGLSDSLYDLLHRVAQYGGDAPVALLIDTAMGREARVARDDGQVLSEIAQVAKTLGIFVGVALDDDISGADGANSPIAASYVIDYLDQEHLYKIVDAHIFQKNSQKLNVLNEIYEEFRAQFPGFRWSKQRFCSLYPLHPATLEVAPLIRLYIQDFALLGFASEAGVRILGRPADSLIGLDEVFDSVESRLRSTDELRQMFAAFDRIESEVIAKSAVATRLPGKLVLKGLFTLSLTGQGASAAEISASMMLTEGTAEEFKVSRILEGFAQALPESITRVEIEGEEPKYCIGPGLVNTRTAALTDSAEAVPDSAAWHLLYKLIAEKFAYPASAETEAVAFVVEWRGSIRRGTIRSGSEVDPLEGTDFAIEISDANGPAPEGGAIQWRVPHLRSDELSVLKRHHVLLSNDSVRDDVGAALATTLQTSAISIEKIWQRVFLQDAVLVSAEGSYAFDANLSSSQSLSQMFSEVLGSIFDIRYPDHPRFERQLNPKNAAALIAGLFGDISGEGSDVNELVKAFAVPMGLARIVDNNVEMAASDAFRSLPIVERLLSGTDMSDGAVTPVETLSKTMLESPWGLTREAQQVVLASLVGQRQLEFVTSSQNRINHRSLDLQIIWEDIVGLTRPSDESLSPDRLLSWAKLVTGNDSLRSIERKEERLLVLESLSVWATQWRSSRFLDEFAELPDEQLNASIWRTAANLKKTFGAMADVIDLAGSNEITIDQCLHRMAELFSDAESEFENKKNDLRVLRSFTENARLRSFILGYLSVCEPTSDRPTELARSQVTSDLGNTGTGGADALAESWERFRSCYTANYLAAHNTARTLTHPDDLKSILRSDDWAAFESLCRVKWFDPTYWRLAEEIVRELRQTKCELDVEEALQTDPVCKCGFQLRDSGVTRGSERLLQVLNDGLTEAARVIKNERHRLLDMSPAGFREQLRQILSWLNDGNSISALKSDDLRCLQRSMRALYDDEAAAGRTFGLEADSDILSDAESWIRQVDDLEVVTQT